MRRHNPNLVKIHRSYTFEELAAVYGVHKNTVASWVKSGLPCMKDRRPFLILGDDVRGFLKLTRGATKRKCKANQLYCMRCKHPSEPAENFVEYVPISSSKGRLVGFCIACECVINKFVSVNSLASYSGIFDLGLPRDLEHIRDSNKPFLNSDFKQ